MAMITTFELNDLVAPRKAPGQSNNDIAASVPLFTIRTFSIEGTQLQISSAISTSSGFGIPKLTPRAAASGAPHHQGRMTQNGRPPGSNEVDISWPSTSQILAPFARSTKNGSPRLAKSADRRIHTAGNVSFAQAQKNRMNEVNMRTK